jgi:putative transcriptional regulator
MKHLVGNLLIAPPALKGNFFQKTVVLLTEHHSRGSVGITLNKPSQMTVSEFAKQNNIMLNLPGFIHIGGPVNVKAFTMLHTTDWVCANTLKVTKEFAISSSPEILTNMAMGYVPKSWRLFVGLCGWGQGQLEKELDGTPPYERNLSWLTATANTEIIFDHQNQSQWTEAIELAGSEFAQKLLA